MSTCSSWPANRTVTPDGLLLLCDRADETGADVCTGLTGKKGVRADATTAPGRIHRRTTLERDQALADLTAEASPAESAGTTASVTEALCFVVGKGTRTGMPEEVQSTAHARAEEVTWTSGTLTVAAVVTDSGTSTPTTCSVGLFSPATGVEWPVTDVETTPSGADLGVTFRVDPQTVAGGRPLPEGEWWPTVHVGTAADATPLLLRTRPASALGGSHPGRPVVSFAEQGRLGIDVGGLRHQLVTRLQPEASEVVESARGSLLTSTVANVDLPAGLVLTGSLRLGGLPVIAWLEGHEDGRVVLSSWVSGLKGSSRLLTKFTPADYADTRSRLVIDEVGGMEVRPAPPKSTKPAGATATPGTMPSQAGPTGARQLAHGAARRARRTAGKVKRAIRR